MRVIYHCFGGSHSSVLAAALHLGMIEKSRLPSPDELLAIPYFDKTTDEDFGSIRQMGIDEYGNQIYVLGKKTMNDRLAMVFTNIAESLVFSDVLLVDCVRHINWTLKIGGYTSRKMGIVAFGRQLINKGTGKAFFDLVKAVEITKLKCMKTTSEVIN